MLVVVVVMQALEAFRGSPFSSCARSGMIKLLLYVFLLLSVMTTATGDRKMGAHAAAAARVKVAPPA